MVSRGNCILLAELRRTQPCSSLEDTVSILHPVLSSKYKLPKLTKVVKAMFDMGSRYKNIEKRLGEGSWLVLGKVNAETTWTKLIRKSGEYFSKVMDYMQKLGLPNLAAEYKGLSAKLLEHELNRYIRDVGIFRAQRPAQGPATSIPMPTPMPVSSDLVFSDNSLIMDVNSQDDGDSSTPGTGGPADPLLDSDQRFDSDEEGFLYLS